MDRLVEALGATPVEWDRKVSCCGASLSGTRSDIVLDLSGEILANARAAAPTWWRSPARCATPIWTAARRRCPAPNGRRRLYITQLMALAFGLVSKAALQRNLIDPRPLLPLGLRLLA